MDASIAPLGDNAFVDVNRSQVEFLRKGDGFKLSVFAPVTDLSSLSKSSTERVVVPGIKNDLAVRGGQVLGDEYSDHVVRVRSGCIVPWVMIDVIFQNRSGIILRERCRFC